MPRSTIHFVDTVPKVASMIDNLQELPTNPPSLYLDLEGIELSRYGTVSLLQVFLKPTSEVYIVDVHNLGKDCFETPGSLGSTLHSILESPDIPKAFFDCRNDSDALYAHFGIALQGVVDIQLMEVAARPAGKSKARLLSLGGALERKDSGLSKPDRLACQAIKRNGKELYDEYYEGGSYEVFNERPLRKAIVDYCAQDVSFLPVLWENYDAKITEEWASKVEVETKERIKESQGEDYDPFGGPSYDPFGDERCYSPWAR